MTICPRGRALGLTSYLPKREKQSVTREEMLYQIRVALGGRAAEELIFEDVTAGVYNDFQKATEMARAMICDYGMTDAFGKVVYSDRKSAEVERAIKGILEEQYALVIKMLKDNKDKLDALALALLEQDTLEAQEIYELLGMHPEVAPVAA